MVSQFRSLVLGTAGPRVGRAIAITMIALITLPQSWAQDKRVYYLVLGSYLSRDIALRELVEFSACRGPLMVMQNEREGKTYYRVQHGPLAVHAEAQGLIGAWRECELEAAWVTRHSGELPPLKTN